MCYTVKVTTTPITCGESKGILLGDFYWVSSWCVVQPSLYDVLIQGANLSVGIFQLHIINVMGVLQNINVC